MSDFEQLKSLTDAMYLRSQQSLRAILLREAKLRGELTKLDTNERLVRVDQGKMLSDMRTIGADLLWEGWLGRTRAQLNLELAKVLAQKEKHIGEVRKTFGKKTVSDKLSQKHRIENEKTMRNRALEVAIGQALQRKI